jgi:hypothetical protein
MRLRNKPSSIHLQKGKEGEPGRGPPVVNSFSFHFRSSISDSFGFVMCVWRGPFGLFFLKEKENQETN